MIHAIAVGKEVKLSAFTRQCWYWCEPAALGSLIWIWACGPVPEESEIKAQPQIVFVSFSGEGCLIQERFVLAAVPSELLVDQILWFFAGQQSHM